MNVKRMTNIAPSSMTHSPKTHRFVYENREYTVCVAETIIPTYLLIGDSRQQILFENILFVSSSITKGLFLAANNMHCNSVESKLQLQDGKY